MKVIVSIFTGLIALGFTMTAFAGNAEVGKMAPDFSLPGKDGKAVKLSSMQGKWVVLEWFNNKCPYVEKHYETQNMQALQKKYTKKGVQWLSVISSAPGKQGHVNTEELAKIDSAWKTHRSNTLFDPSGKVGKMYDAKTTPHMFVIDPQGKIVYAGAIDDNSSSKQSAVKGAKNYVAAALDSGLKGEAIAVSSTKPYGCSVKY